MKISEIYGSDSGSYTLIVIVALTSLVSISWALCTCVACFQRAKQQKLNIQVCQILLMVKDFYEFALEIKDRPESEGLYDWRAKHIIVSGRIDSEIRVAFMNSEGSSVSTYPLKCELRNRPADCAKLVALRIIKETGLSNLEDEESRDWLFSVIRNLILINLDKMLTVESYEDKPSEEQYRRTFDRCFSRLRGMIESRPFHLGEI